MQVKKKHHYVWKEYLKAWSENNQVPALIKKSGKIIKANPEGLAQQRYFYALEEFTQEEEIILKKLVNQWSKESTIKINLEFYETFTSYSKLKRLTKTINLNDELKETLNLLRTNTMEDSHLIFENFGKKLISIRTYEDLSFLNDEMELFFTMIYISFQYLRTKNMQLKVKDVIEKYDYLSPKFLNFLPFIYATSIADTLTYDKHIKFIFLENTSEIDFITSDQPLINNKIDQLNYKGTIAQLDIYYPITPRIALLIHYQEQKEKYKKVELNSVEVNKYNETIYNHSNEFVFASLTEQLDEYKNCKITPY
ncbi:MAG: DUF4238 domain-containing protein [Flavobacteriaceae bacterium]